MNNLYTRRYFALLGLIMLPQLAGASPDGCKIPPKGVEEVDASACFSHPNLRFLDTPPARLNVEDIRQGPPAKRGFRQEDEVLCAYTYHPKSQTSPKMRCNLMDAQGMLLSEDGEAVPQARSVGASGTAFDEILLDAQGAPVLDSEGKPIKADELKVKYFRGGSWKGNQFQGSETIQDSRTREGFIEVAVSRLFWAIGMPGDRMYGVQKLQCLGCGEDPFTQLAPAQTNATFRYVGIERKWEGKTIEKSWDAGKLTDKYMPGWSPRQKLELEVFALAMGLINYHHFLPKQNRVACAKGSYDTKTLECRAPVLMVQDVGGAFGRESKSLFGLGENPRGSFKDWSKTTIFKKSDECRLTNSLGSVKSVSQAAVNELARRLKPLSREHVRAIFESAQFGKMEPKLTAELGGEDRVIDAWTDGMMRRFAEIQQRKCAE